MKPAAILTPLDWRRFSDLLGLLRRGGGVSPTYREIAAVWGVSPGSAHHLVGRFCDAGLIRRRGHRHRAIEVCRNLVPVRRWGRDPVLLPMGAA